MSPQLAFQLKRVLILAVLAALGAVAANLQTVVLDPVYYIAATAVVAALIQIVTGLQDTERAKRNELIPSDVGYSLVQAYRAEPQITPKGRLQA